MPVIGPLLHGTELAPRVYCTQPWWTCSRWPPMGLPRHVFMSTLFSAKTVLAVLRHAGWLCRLFCMFTDGQQPLKLRSRGESCNCRRLVLCLKVINVLKFYVNACNRFRGVSGKIFRLSSESIAELWTRSGRRHQARCGQFLVQ